MVTVAYRPPVSESSASASAESVPTRTTTAASVASDSPSAVDKVVATTIASSLAESTGMPISNNVANLSQSLAVESVLGQTDTNVISKPQIVQPTASGQTVQTYVTVAGDSVNAVAQKYGISPTTLKWSNSLTSDALEPGRTLTILPVDGTLYTAKSGDTVASIASKYGASAETIVAYNNLELSGAPVAGTKLVIPGGVLPETERPGYVAPRAATNAGVGYGNFSGGYGSSYSGNVSVGNRYAWGNCTWYAYERRQQLGRPVGSFWGNASTWAYNARMAGFTVNGTPAAGAVMANGGGYGHVSIVESVNPGVSITISEMNGYRFGGGFARVGNGEIDWATATSGYYQYIH